MSVLLTHLSEVIRNNLAQLLSYKDMRALLDRLDPEYKRLIDDICPSQISYSGLQAVLKLLLGERVSIRNLHLDPGGGRGDRAACPALRAGRRACADAHRPADLRRSGGGRRAQGAAARQPLGPGVPPGPEARRQGRGRRFRCRSAHGRAVRRRGVGGDPRAHGPGARASCWSPRPMRGPTCG